jgi:hypothetical protein
MKKSDDKQIEDEIYKLCKPHFEKVLQEKLPDSMTTPKRAIRLLIRFNNYRRQQQIKVYKDSTIKKIQSAIPHSNYIERTKLLFVTDYKEQITIMLGKNTITGIWHQNIINGQKQAYVLEAENLEQVDKWFDEKKIWIEQSIDDALKEFIKKFGLRCDLIFKPIEKRKEIEVKGEEYIDSLPQELILHDTVGKKVYDSGFEFKNEIYAKNYIKNRAIEGITPALAEQLMLLCKQIEVIDAREKALTESMIWMDKNNKSHKRVLSKLEKAIDKLSEKIDTKSTYPQYPRWMVKK